MIYSSEEKKKNFSDALLLVRWISMFSLVFLERKNLVNRSGGGIQG
jgi:hypothetical protein